MKWQAVVFCLAYLAGAFLTGGYYANHRCEEDRWRPTSCGFDSVAAGYIWPAYWAARGALVVTR